MILVDTSAWIAFLLDTGSAACIAIDRLLDEDLATCDAVSMEVLAGARDERHLLQLRGLLERTTMPATTPAGFEAAGFVRTPDAMPLRRQKIRADIARSGTALTYGAAVWAKSTDTLCLASSTLFDVSTLGIGLPPRAECE